MSEHAHNHGENANARQLGIALALTGTFLVERRTAIWDQLTATGMFGDGDGEQADG